MELIDYLPNFYHNSEEVKNIQASIEVEHSLLQDKIVDLLDQLFVNTATWGLEYWEKYLGLDIDRNETLENRRSRIMTRLRGQGTVTKEMLKNVCSSFSGGEVEIIEISNEYRFVIKFIGTIGIPKNMSYLSKSIDEIKPAHLSYTFEYTFNTYEVLKRYTHNQLSNYTHIQIREEALNA